MSDPWVEQIIPVAISVSRNELSCSCCLFLHAAAATPARPCCSPACPLRPLVPCVSETMKTASLAPRYRPLCLTVSNMKFCISLADTLRQNQRNISRIRPQNPGLSLCHLPSFWARRSSLGSFAFWFFKSALAIGRTESPGGVRSDCLTALMPSQGFRYSLGQERFRSKLIQPQKGSHLYLPLPGQLLWPPAFSITFSLKMRSEVASCTPRNGDNLGAEICFGGCISSTWVERQQT